MPFSIEIVRRHAGNNRNRKRHSSKLRSTFETCGNRHASAYPARLNSTPEITHQRPRLPDGGGHPSRVSLSFSRFDGARGATRKSESTVARPSRPIHARPRRFLQAGEKLFSGVRRPVVNCIPGQESAFRHVGAFVCRIQWVADLATPAGYTPRSLEHRTSPPTCSRRAFLQRKAWVEIRTPPASSR